MILKENEIIMCTVKKIEGTTVFIETENLVQGSIVFSEIAAGRIRNIREYVSPSKKIVCKILKIYPDHIELSLRRVTGREREEIQERYKKQKTFENMLKATAKNSQELILRIKEKYELWEFYDLVKESPKVLDEFMSKSESEALVKVLLEKKEKEKVVKKKIIVKSTSEKGLEDIKYILQTEKAKANYLGSSQFMLEISGKDYKEAEVILNQEIKKMETKAKEKKAFFEVKSD